MKNHTTQAFLVFALSGLLVSSCATQNGNPAHAQPNKGYVDFYADPAGDVWWEVDRFDAQTQSFTSVFSQFKPVPNGILRLEFAPGRYRLQANFPNRTVLDPAETEVEVKDGMITPVRVTFSAADTTIVKRKTTSVGGTAYGRYGRRTKIEGSEHQNYQAVASPEPPQAYRPKEQMPYAR